jgi:hypothetical protein
VLDDGYVPLRGAASGLARRLPGSTASGFVELFKTALFNGEFDDRPEDFGETGVAWLKAVTETSKRRYGFNRCSVVMLLLGANALPPDPAMWESLFDVIGIMRGEEPGYDILSRTPFDDYPERGRRELEALMVRRSVLANFLRSCCKVPSLPGTGGSQAAVHDVSPANENNSLVRRPAHLRGRPRKTAWPRIVELAQQLAREHPDWQRKRLAFEAWTHAREMNLVTSRYRRLRPSREVWLKSWMGRSEGIGRDVWPCPAAARHNDLRRTTETLSPC